MNTLSVLRQRPHISVSQIKAYLMCPRRHAYIYIERIKPSSRSIALAFGTAWHAAIGALLQGEEQVADVFRDVLAREVHDGEVPVLFEDEEDLGACTDLGVRMLEVFKTSVPMPERAVAIELAFGLNLHDPDTGEVLAVPLIGSIDAVVIDGDRPAIWELKTAKKKWTRDQIDFDLQTTAYKMGAHVHSIDAPALEIVITTKTKTPAVQRERVTRTTRDEQELARVAASVLRAVDAGVDHPLRGWQCKTCPYAGRCG